MITRKDVANKAGVSVTIVSRVLNNSGYVAKEKREAVRKAVKELNYRPNPVALSLKKNRTRQILYYVSDLSNYFYMELYQGMMAYALKKNYLIVVSGALQSSQISQIMIDGMILPNEYFSKDVFTQGLTIPMIVASHGLDSNPKFSNVDADTGIAMQMALDYLKNKGHKRIAYASKHKQDLENPRHQRFCDFMRSEYGDAVDQYILGRNEDEIEAQNVNYFECGRKAAQDYLIRRLEITAIVCFNDDTAIGLMSELYKHNIKIPDDLSVIGIDGQLEGQYSSPPLTSVSLNPQLQGKLCAEYLIGYLDQKKGKDIISQPRKINVPLTLIERESVRQIDL